MKTLLPLAVILFLFAFTPNSSTRELTRINTIIVCTDSLQKEIFYTSGMMIDADGSPRAYHPVSDSGLDALGNAGKPGNWWALVTKDGKPVIQGKNDPCPGYYISMTSLEDFSKKETDPSRYVNSETIPYFVLPNNKTILSLIHKGDIAEVTNLRNGKKSFAIFADVGPKDKIGEGSICLAERLDIPSSPRKGGVRDSIRYRVFSGSGLKKPLTISEIDSIGNLFAK